MLTDCRGCSVSAEGAGEVQAYDAALQAFLNYENAAGAMVKQALAEHPDSVMTRVLRGAMLMMLESSALHPKVTALVDETVAGCRHANRREQQHLQALRAWAGGEVRAACAAWEQLLALDPRDLLALKLHHYTTFWTGRSHALLNTVNGVIDAWEPDVPGRDHVLGMRAFALNETGRYESAELLAREAVATNPEDLWSIHAVAHAIEMQSHPERGDAFFEQLLAERPDRWRSKNPFLGHIWWHAALFPWEAGHHDRVLDLYDNRLRPASTDFFLDIQNLSSLLTRLELSGVDVGDRWEKLGDHAVARIGDHVLAFTDVHCALTLARAGRSAELDRFVASLRDHATGHGHGPDADGPRAALAVSEALLASEAGDHGRAAAALLAMRHDLAPIGGSHAQRDLFDLLAVDEAVSAGRVDEAVAVLRARLVGRPNSVPARDRLDALLAAH